MQVVLQWIVDVFNWCIDTGPFVDFYAKELRGNLFNGFLTIAAFLLSVKTFIVILLQKEVYGTEQYRNQINEQKQVNAELTIYGPLKRLSGLMTWTVILTLITAVLQLTLGPINSRVTTILCLFAAASCVALLFGVVWVMRNAMLDYFDQLEKQHGR